MAARKKRRSKNQPRLRWLLPLPASLVSIVSGLTICLLLAAIIPISRGWTIPIIIVGFPAASGGLLLFNLGHPRPWWTLLGQLVIGIVCGVIAWQISEWRW